jgi:hypothetical protein
VLEGDGGGGWGGGAVVVLNSELLQIGASSCATYISPCVSASLGSAFSEFFIVIKSIMK